MGNRLKNEFMHYDLIQLLKENNLKYINEQNVYIISRKINNFDLILRFQFWGNILLQ